MATQAGSFLANAGVPADRAELAAGRLNTSQQLGTALSLAIFSAIATARTRALLAVHIPAPVRSPQASTRPCWFARSSC